MCLIKMYKVDPVDSVEKFGGIDGQRNLLNKKFYSHKDPHNTNWTFTADYDIFPGID